MNVKIEGIHYTPSEHTMEYIDKLLPQIDYLKEYVVDLDIRLIKEKRDYSAEADIHLRWGSYFHIKTEEHELYKAIDFLIDKVEQKIIKEKDKVQKH